MAEGNQVGCVPLDNTCGVLCVGSERIVLGAAFTCLIKRSIRSARYYWLAYIYGHFMMAVAGSKPYIVDICSSQGNIQHTCSSRGFLMIFVSPNEYFGVVEPLG